MGLVKYIKFTNIETGEQFVSYSLKEASLFFGKSHTWVSKSIKNNKVMTDKDGNRYKGEHLLGHIAPIKRNTNYHEREPQLCESCEKVFGDCSWSRLNSEGRVEFVPVEGWDAEPVYVENELYSYRIKSCPEYKEG